VAVVAVRTFSADLSGCSPFLSELVNLLVNDLIPLAVNDGPLAESVGCTG
jgi:hypothetical protein